MNVNALERWVEKQMLLDPTTFNCHVTMAVENGTFVLEMSTEVPAQEWEYDQSTDWSYSHFKFNSLKDLVRSFRRE